MHIYTKTKAEHQSTDVNKVRSWGYMCTHLTANVLSSPYQILSKSCLPEKRTKVQEPQRTTELVTVHLTDYLHQNKKPEEDHVCSFAGAVRVSESYP